MQVFESFDHRYSLMLFPQEKCDVILLFNLICVKEGYPSDDLVAGKLCEGLKN